MAEWNDNVKHPKSSINNGQQYTKDDNVTLESLNNTIENSFYAVRVAENAQSATNNAVSYNAQTPLATEQIQAQKNLGIDQTITFAESERQKSEADGAIVHKNDIEPVLIYEMQTKNTIGGGTYTAGIPFYSTTISNVDLSPYKHVRFTCRWNPHGDNWFGGTITFDLDLTTPYNSDANYMAVISSRPSNCYIDDSATTFDLIGQIVVNGSKNLFSVNGYKLTYTGQRTAYTADNYLQYFRIEKMEGYK